MKIPACLCLAALALSMGACSRKKPVVSRTGSTTAAIQPSRPQAPAQPRRMNQGVDLTVGSLPPGTLNSYSRAAVNGPYIAITFDDGPHASNTPRLLDMLASRRIRGTFFTVGTNVARYPAIVRRIVAEGHEMANHTWTHPKLSGLSDSGVRGELDRANTGLLSVAGIAPRMYRPPYGAITARQKQWIMDEYGYPTILWSVDPEDWKRPGPAVITNRILTNTKPGAIILVHDIHAPSIDAMPATLDGLLSRGFRFVTVSQLIALTKSGPTAPPPVTAMYTPGSF